MCIQLVILNHDLTLRWKQTIGDRISASPVLVDPEGSGEFIVIFPGADNNLYYVDPVNHEILKVIDRYRLYMCFLIHEYSHNSKYP